ncbi:uncharacterized protein EV422DRAFT_540498 [Fimicolochytrium jonesii]|uniref:uncharacterized protein n=1 Tax=Fimicolochytrium jonesii TaxID=1396493 RepID=UPI0022FEB05D|nr:uncharacterized protein EV422DRAFT_540498 [Fimicolochytrium jonesii]KAI8817680.1 hypothetical protein EV422DRAFT_540498 [Fimicolochytrium jonesii]
MFPSTHSLSSRPSTRGPRPSSFFSLLILLLSLSAIVTVNAGGAAKPTTTKTTPTSTKAATTTATPTTTAKPPTATDASTFTARQVILILTTTGGDVDYQTKGLDGYGIPYEVAVVPPTGYPNASALPIAFEDAAGNARYSVVMISPGQLPIQVGGVWQSALTTVQWGLIEAYEAKHKIRRVTFDDSPSPSHGTAAANPAAMGCCNTGVTQPIQLALNAELLKSGVVNGAQVPSTGLWHYPSVITNATSTTAFANLGPSSDGAFKTTTGVGFIVKYPNGREAMVHYMGCGWWSPTCNLLTHVWVSWATRQLYDGFRRIQISLQIDDVFLPTDTNATYAYRLNPTDLANILTWQTAFNKRMPPGSNITLSLAYNGWGVVTKADPNLDPLVTDIERIDNFIKPPGTGTNMWPPASKLPALRAFTKATLKKDTLFNYVDITPAVQTGFYWLSHTYTHLQLDNATRYDIDNELQFNIHFATIAGIASYPTYTSRSLIPPAITGLHNADVLASFKANGIDFVTGDDTRDDVTNRTHPLHPWISSLASSNYAGYTVIPRQATVIYYNCSQPGENMILYNNMYAAVQGTKDFAYLMNYEIDRVTQILLNLRQDGFMFHQANLRNADQPLVTIAATGVQGKFGLLQIWSENVLGRLAQLVRWPLVTKDITSHSQTFLDRMERDYCGRSVLLTRNATHWLSLSATSASKCNVPITVPGPVLRADCPAGVCTYEQIGVDPLTVWVALKGGESRTLRFSPAIAV